MVHRPLATAGGTEAYPTPFARAAALAESLIRRHPFVDGNKRTAIMAMAFWLEREGFQLNADPGDLPDLALDLATGAMPVQELGAWLEDHAIAM